MVKWRKHFEHGIISVRSRYACYWHFNEIVHQINRKSALICSHRRLNFLFSRSCNKFEIVHMINAIHHILQRFIRLINIIWITKFQFSDVKTVTCSTQMVIQKMCQWKWRIQSRNRYKNIRTQIKRNPNRLPQRTVSFLSSIFLAKKKRRKTKKKLLLKVSLHRKSLLNTKVKLIKWIHSMNKGNNVIFFFNENYEIDVKKNTTEWCRKQQK